MIAMCASLNLFTSNRACLSLVKGSKRACGRQEYARIHLEARKRELLKSKDADFIK